MTLSGRASLCLGGEVQTPVHGRAVRVTGGSTGIRGQVTLMSIERVERCVCGIQPTLIHCAGRGRMG